MEHELTEIEKAACYIQMLKQEGKLDEAAIPELLQMYQITQEEAETLLASFKQTEAYKSSVTSILKEQLVTIICFVIFGIFFLFVGLGDSDNKNLFALHGLVYLLGAFGLTVYLFKLLRERFADNEKYGWIANKALTYVIVLSFFVGYLQYQFSQKTYLLNTSNWQINTIKMTSDCKEVSTGGKNPIYYYEFFCSDYQYPIRWYKESHLYAFNKNLQPNIYLHKGDSITIYITDLAKRNDYISIGNVIKNNEVFLNINARNEKAKVNANNKNILSLFTLLIAIFYFIFIEVRRKRKIS